jgi:hypothetical protein
MKRYIATTLCLALTTPVFAQPSIPLPQPSPPPCTFTYDKNQSPEQLCEAAAQRLGVSSMTWKSDCAGIVMKFRQQCPLPPPSVETDPKYQAALRQHNECMSPTTMAICNLPGRR